MRKCFMSIAIVLVFIMLTACSSKDKTVPQSANGKDIEAGSSGTGISGDIENKSSNSDSQTTTGTGGSPTEVKPTEAP
jgi:hypothetical protein